MKVLTSSAPRPAAACQELLWAGPVQRQRPTFRWSDIWSAPLHDFPIRDEIIYQFLPLSPTMDLLEIGPGSGFTSCRLARQVRSVTLLDVSASNIARLRQQLQGIPNLDFISADVCSPKLRDSTSPLYHAIFGLESLEYVPDPQACFRNLAALLVKGGLLVMQWPNYPNSKTGGVTHFATIEQLDSMLDSAGFESWALFSLVLRPFANLLFRYFHEKPLRLYRRLRHGRGSNRPQAFDETWAFQQGHQIERFKIPLHAAWTILSLTMRAGGNCFTRTLIRQGSIQRNLLLVARR